MNLLEQKGYLSKMICGSNFSYILNEEIFLPTEYKVLQSQNNSCFVKCMKMLYNGKTQLYYFTEGYKSFLSMLPRLDTEGFMTIVANLFTDIVDVKSNGFLSCQNIDLSFEHVYVDPATYKVSLVYLPLSKKAYNGDSAFENEMRANLIKLIAETPALASPKTTQLTMELSDGMLSLEDLCNRMKVMGGRSVFAERPVTVSKPAESVKMSVLRFKTLNAAVDLVLEMNKDKYVIGKNPAAVDGVVSFNKAISRVHCCIEKVGTEYKITDLESANGTFVNGTRLQPHKPYRINNGDTVRLADTDFQVTM